MLDFAITSMLMRRFKLTIDVRCESFVPSVSLHAGGLDWQITLHLL